MRAIAFGLSLILIFTIPWEAFIVFPGLGTVSRAIGLFVAAFWVLTVIVTGRFRKPHTFHIVAFLFLLWVALSAFWSVYLDVTMKFIQTFLQMAVFALILWDLYTTRAAVRGGLQAYVLGAWVTLGSVVANYLRHQGEWGRYSASGFNANGAALILALGVPMAWYLATQEANNRADRILRLVNYSYVPAAAFAISLTATRFAVLALLPAFIYGIGTLTRLKPLPRVLIFLVLAVAVFALPTLIPQSSIDRIATIEESVRAGDLGGRIAIWRQGFTIFSEHPLIGIGSGTFPTASESGMSAHNSVLVVLAELGIIGFFLFGTILAIVVYQATRQPKWDSRFWLTLLLVWAIGSSALSWVHTKPTWLILSLVVAASSVSVQPGESRQGAQLRVKSPGLLKGKRDETHETTPSGRGTGFGSIDAGGMFPLSHGTSHDSQHFSSS